MGSKQVRVQDKDPSVGTAVSAQDGRKGDRKWLGLQEVGWPTGSGLAYRKWSHLFSLPLGMTARRSVLLRSLQTYVFLRVMPADAAVL